MDAVTSTTTVSATTSQTPVEVIPTTGDYLMYGETVYFRYQPTHATDSYSWLNGGRGKTQSDVYTRTGDGPEANYRWTIMKSREEAGHGLVNFGDTIYLKVGGDYDRWLAGTNTKGAKVTTSNSDTASYKWEVRWSRSDHGRGPVQRGRFLLYLVGSDPELYLVGGAAGDNRVYTIYERESDTDAWRYQWTATSLTYSQAFAIFAEDSPATKDMVASKMNSRVFTFNEVSSPGRRIQRDPDTGVVTVEPGTYHVTGFSQVCYDYDASSTHIGDQTIKTESFSNAGYCVLRHDGDGTAADDVNIVIGSMSNANCDASMFDAIFSTGSQAKLILEHQSGNSVTEPQIVLRNQPQSKTDKYIMARLAIFWVPPTASPQDYAIFSERSIVSQKVDMDPGMKQRICDGPSVSAGTRISFDSKTGIVTVKPGTYRLRGFSMVRYQVDGEAAGKTLTQADANAGYCRVCLHKTSATQTKDTTIATGSLATANCVPSMFDTVFSTLSDAQLVLQHLSGNNVTAPRIVMRDGTNEHFMARFAIYRL